MARIYVHFVLVNVVFKLKLIAYNSLNVLILDRQTVSKPIVFHLFFASISLVNFVSYSMEYRHGQGRNQHTLYSTCLDDMIGSENTVRAIDEFVNNLDLPALGFKTIAGQGRPLYHPVDLLKLYIYGYMN